MTTKRCITLGLLCFCLAASAGRAQTGDPAVPTYVNENSKDAAPIILDGLSGKVQGLGKDAISRATVSLFTEDRHMLVSSVNTDRDGKFKFDHVDHGFYRVVARVPGLCPANIPIRVEGSMLAHHKLVITMVAKDIDTCSYGTTK